MRQAGIPDRYYWYKGFSRYEHSTGVMLLLRIFGANLEEQVAGLLHDVSHLAFSHVADWLFHEGKNGKEIYHELIQKKFISKTQIPQILQKYNLDIEKIFQPENYPLLEKDCPNLCADRIDYFLRQLYYFGERDLTENILGYLIVKNEEFIFDNIKTAKSAANRYLDMQMQNWSDKHSIINIHIFSNVLRLALDKNIIARKDFEKDDEYIMQKIESSNLNEIKESLLLLKNNKSILKLYKKEGIKVHKKFRYIDPKITVNNGSMRLSEIDISFRERLNICKEKNNHGILI
jgi:HD superfamily phosphohydrolase